MSQRVLWNGIKGRGISTWIFIRPLLQIPYRVETIHIQCLFIQLYTSLISHLNHIPSCPSSCLTTWLCTRPPTLHPPGLSSQTVSPSLHKPPTTSSGPRWPSNTSNLWQSENTSWPADFFPRPPQPIIYAGWAPRSRRYIADEMKSHLKKQQTSGIFRKMQPDSSRKWIDYRWIPWKPYQKSTKSAPLAPGARQLRKRDSKSNKP